MNYNINYSKQAKLNDLPKLSVPIKASIQKAIEDKLLTHPLKFGKPLREPLKGLRSLRVGTYRILYQVNKDTVYVVTIRHRKDVYE